MAAIVDVDTTSTRVYEFLSSVRDCTTCAHGRGIDVTVAAYRYCTFRIINVIVAAAIALDHFLDSIISQILFTLK